ncbi:FAD-dependent monooxygenase, partial [Burkholderia multivorans]
RIDTGAAYRARFGNPYAVIHRADIHLSIYEAVRNHPLIEFRTSTQVCGFEQDGNGVTVIDQHGERYRAEAVIGCDGVKSAIRHALIGDAHR